MSLCLSNYHWLICLAAFFSSILIHSAVAADSPPSEPVPMRYHGPIETYAALRFFPGGVITQ